MMRQEKGSDQEPGDLEVQNRPSRVRVSAVVAVAAAVAIVLWVALGGGSSSSPSHAASPQSATGPQSGSFPSHTTTTAASQQALSTAVRRLHRLVFWKGPARNTLYALTRTTQGWIYVSYLTPGSKLTSIHASPFVATFPKPNAYAATSTVAHRSSSVSIPVPAGEVAFYYRQYPTSAYLAFKGSDVQIEVFDPVPGQTRALISSGQIRPVLAGRP